MDGQIASHWQRASSSGGCARMEQNVVCATRVHGTHGGVVERELNDEVGSLREIVGRYEEKIIRQSLEMHGDNRTKTALALGISRQALNEKLRKYSIGRLK